jgi:hypothetical protein
LLRDRAGPAEAAAAAARGALALDPNNRPARSLVERAESTRPEG